MRELSYKKIKVGDLVTDEALKIRQTLSQDAILRYRDLWREKGSCPALKVQKGTMRVIDGWHRLEAAKAEGVKVIPCEILDIPDSELRALAYQFNRGHGVPISLEERNKTIEALFLKDGKTEEEIGNIIGLSKGRISQTLESLGAKQTKLELTLQEQRAMIRLILQGERQKDLAKKFERSEGFVSQIKSKWFDGALKVYKEGALKREVAEQLDLEISEVDAILQTFGDPLNFTPLEPTLWLHFGIDERFGKRHPGNKPAELVRNLLCRLTKPGDLILDPFAGGGVVIDVCADMVNRKCEAFDLTPVREDIRQHDILKGPPRTSRAPDLIFLDPPYGPEKQYSDKETDLSNFPVEDFLLKMEHIFAYWDRGRLVCMMTVCTKGGLHNFVPLPSKIEVAMERSGWKFDEWIVNQIGRTEGTDELSVSRLQKANWWSHRDDLHIIIGRKDK